MTPEPAYPLNAWYPAAWSHEIGRSLFARKICDTNIVLYRRQDGAAVALEDACWHRLLPLSLGRLERRRGRLRLSRARFQRRRPLQLHAGAEDDQPFRLRARLSRRRAASARLGLAGRSRARRPRRVPDFHWNDGTEWVGDGGTFVSLKCDWRLVVDNLMDLTHETYVHSDSIGDDAILDTPFDVTHDRPHRDHDALDDRHRAAAVLGASSSASRAPSTAGRSSASRRPAVVVGDVGVAPTGTGRAARATARQGVNGAFLAALAPETETSCHYFWNFVRTFRRDDEALTRGVAASRMSTTARASTIRTIACWRRSSARSSAIRASRSTI